MPKPNLTDIERKAIIDELLKLSDNGVLPSGVYVKVSLKLGCAPTTVSRIWKRYAVAVAEGVVGGVWASQIKTKCDISFVGRQNKPQRVEHALSFIDDTTLHFEPMTNLLHVDEKWIYADRNWRSYLVFDGEELPPRVWKSKRFIPKTMFLAALARRR
ncbi:hypothetical protein L915_21981 [Phytophthora nicotianae]|uniref:DUF7769 domain-containing protein n=1 Tax=Phytophthora nicotianae TaxID=4792 RepID=W2I8W1_PHYNI|nr:hypothetical protein L915_21981 [Phytophthora nicotianae]ETL30669.1 hypothetical protein L916_16403 [Phytophthora nicotianae]